MSIFSMIELFQMHSITKVFNDPQIGLYKYQYLHLFHGQPIHLLGLNLIPYLTDSFHKLKQYKLMKRLVKQPFAI
jgi:ABC-type arginine/histidine transport system permease subunit